MKLLDHGYIKLIETWGSDERIIEAARQSTNKGFLGWDPGPCPDCEGTGTTMALVTEYHPEIQLVKRHTGAFRLNPPPEEVEKSIACLTCMGKGEIKGDAALLRFLYSNKHSTPFEMGGLVIELEAPIMVYREWHRHRTQSYAEMSARYTPIPNTHYFPTPERCLMVSGTNKQAGVAAGAADLTHEMALDWLDALAGVYEHAEYVYQRGLQMGIPKELARLPMPVGRYSRMRAQALLRNWLAFLTLREAPNAQWEIRQYAHAVNGLLVEHFPRTMELFNG